MAEKDVIILVSVIGLGLLLLFMFSGAYDKLRRRMEPESDHTRAFVDQLNTRLNRNVELQEAQEEAQHKAQLAAIEAEAAAAPVTATVEPAAEPEPEEITYPKLRDHLRTEHMVIVGSPGSGKSQTLQSLILDDLETNASIIVIDSQAALIDNLLNVVPANRLVHLTPSDKLYPVALNMFQRDQDSSLYEYIFSSNSEALTPKMAMVYRYVSRLVSVIPNGTIDTMRAILEKGGLAKYQQYVNQLPPIAQDFFTNEFSTRAYEETKQGVLRRLYSLLENDVFLSMFTANQNKVNIAKEIEEGKVILIDTAKRTLGGEAYKIFGRFFIAQVSRAVFSRQHPYPHRVYLYIDEFADYAGDEGFIEELLTQARKWNVGVIIAFQFLAQMPDRVLRAILSNTAIKMVGSVASADRRAMASEMGLEPEVLGALKKGEFAIHYKGEGAYRWLVNLGRLERLGKRSRDELDAIRHQMREKYSVLAGLKYTPPEDDDGMVEEEN